MSANDSEDAVRTQLEEQYGEDNVWDTKEVQEVFKVEGFQSPVALVTRKSDGKRGTVSFIHRPRFYFDFTEGN